jgi:hypothetical protein
MIVEKNAIPCGLERWRVVVGLIFASCGGSSLPTPTSLKALAQLDKPGSSDSQDKCLTDWWVRHLTADQLGAAAQVKSAADIAKDPAVFGYMAQANAACLSELGDGSNS